MAAKFQTPIQIATAPKKYKPVRQCIYCGRRSGKISTEHILAFGLAADSPVLPNASCRRCSEKTRDFETACLRHMWWPFRTSIGAPSRGKEKPDSFLLRTAKVTNVSEDGYIQYDDKMETSVAPAEYPLYYFAYKFPQPGVLVGRAPRANITYEAWMAYSEEEMRKAVKEDREAVRLGPGVPEAFCRLLAKTAHLTCPVSSDHV